MRIENPRLRAAIFYTFLRPMIVVNYWLRRRKLLRDEWFWADALAFSWGYVVWPRAPRILVDREGIAYLPTREVKLRGKSR